MKLPISQRVASLSATTVALAALATAPAHADGSWQKVGSDARTGVSGLAYEGRTEDGTAVRALVVHDNKLAGQQRLSRITHREGSDDVSLLTWDGAEPVDLEAIEGVPGAPGEFMALASRGIVYHLNVTGSTATVIDYSPLPRIGAGDNFEGFALVSQNGKLAALWADRGAGAARPSAVYAAPVTFTPWGQPEFGAVTRKSYQAAYPTDGATRHVSDISVTESGKVTVSSAADAGDDGPFDSVVSQAGTVTVTATGKVRLVLAATPIVIGKFPQHKVEGLECLPGSSEALLGTDDENLGGYLRTASLC
ncbi:hypothetical protein [Streptomyces sioyaensis]|uniref:hypothetical protein n=1 Tax=Streptomyces sioyaensis TaxID=67364 RepID=UPI0036EA1039